MLTEVKNQIKVSFLSIKYALLREMLNKTTFISNIVFMILNNASFIIQWIIIYSLRDDVGGYDLNKVLLLWALAASTYGFSRFFFKKSYELSDMINTGKLDAFLVQPKNVLISSITTDITTSALGDLIYGYIILFIYGVNIKTFLLFTFLTITGGLILTSITVILNSLSFWFSKSEVIADRINDSITMVATYPEGIFKGVVRLLLYTIVPVGIVAYIPVNIISSFDLKELLIVTFTCIVLVIISFIVFYRGLKRYSSSNLMVARL